MAKDLMDKYIKYLNLDKPIWYRYGNWMWRMLRHGDLGLAFGAQGGGLVYQEPVKEIVASTRLPVVPASANNPAANRPVS